MNNFICPHCGEAVKIEKDEKIEKTCIHLYYNKYGTTSRKIGYYCNLHIMTVNCGSSCSSYISY